MIILIETYDGTLLNLAHIVQLQLNKYGRIGATLSDGDSKEKPTIMYLTPRLSAVYKYIDKNKLTQACVTSMAELQRCINGGGGVVQYRRYAKALIKVLDRLPAEHKQDDLGGRPHIFEWQDDIL